MKLDPKLKDFYLRALKIPIVGKYIFGPFLRLSWKVYSNSIDKKMSYKNKIKNEEVNFASYASVLHSLRVRVEELEKKCQELQGKLEGEHYERKYRDELNSSVFDGIYHSLNQKSKEGTK
jgi:hypothetical protein